MVIQASLGLFNVVLVIAGQGVPGFFLVHLGCVIMNVGL